MVSACRPPQPKRRLRTRVSSLKLGALTSVRPQLAATKIVNAVGRVGSVTRAARALRVSRRSLTGWIAALGISRDVHIAKATFRQRFRIPKRMAE